LSIIYATGARVFVIKRFKNFYKKLKLLIKNIFDYKPSCCLIDINPNEKYVIICCSGIKNPIKFTFDEIIQDIVILSSLSSKQSSIIGYYYGKQYHGGNKNYSHYLDIFSQSGNTCAFYLQMINRNGELVYHDTISNSHQRISIIKAFTDNKIINKFSPIQSCYIGILAGAEVFKRKATVVIKNHKEVKLHIIK